MAGAVTVYLKHPAGLHLRLHEFAEGQVPVMGGGFRKEKVAVATGEAVTLNGTAAPFGQARKDKNGNFVRIVAGYAVTEDVPKEFWDRWIAQNAELDLVRNRLVYAHEKPVEGDAWAKDHTATRTGLEPLTPTVVDGAGRVMQSDPRSPKGIALADRKEAA